MKLVTVLLPIITMGMAACAAHDNKAMAGGAVGTPDEKPMAPAFSNPSPPPVSHNPQAPGSENTIVQIGDVLAVSVAEDRTYNGYYEIRRGGYIILPSVGRIDASNLTLKEIDAKVSKALEDTQLPHATVNVERLGGSDNGR